MRTETIIRSFYKFDELSEDAKDCAIGGLCDINVDYNWWDSAEDDADAVGIDITNFDLSQGSTSLRVSDAESTCKKILTTHGEDCDTVKSAKQFQAAILKAKLLNSSEDDFSPEEEDFITNLSSDYLKILRNEYEYLTSKEVIIGTIRANDYEFTEDGELI